MQMVYLGAAGVLTFGDHLVDQLPRAIHTVAEGRLWIRREILSAYVQKTGSVLRKMAAWEEKLTLRERQITDLLYRGLSNRSISQRLAICERTVKFHVSNILHKMNVVNRRELQALGSSPGSFSPEWLAPQEPAEVPPPFVVPRNPVRNKEE
jgi:DNA-binding NarL/FixJ family response regulator